MKTFTKIHLLALMSMFVGLSSHAAIDVTDISAEFEQPKSYAQSGIGFEFENDTKQTVWIAVDNKKTEFAAIEVPATGLINEIKGANTIQKQIDISGSTTLYIWFQNPGEVSHKKSILGLFGATKIEPQPNRVYSFAPGKTIYVTLDKQYVLKPSQILPGSIATETGLSLENNVQQDISLLSQQE